MNTERRKHRRDSRGALARRRRQAGMSMIALLALMGATVFVGLFALKVGPAYFENMTIAKIVEDKSANEALMRGPRNKIYASLNQAYRTNSLYSLTAEDTIRLTRDADRGHVMDIAYERRSNLFANIDVVTVFGEPTAGAAIASR